jgi:tRNA-binding protein
MLYRRNEEKPARNEPKPGRQSSQAPTRSRKRFKRETTASSEPIKELSLPEISLKDFEKVDVRVGTVVEAEPFPEARKPSIKLMVDFGPEVGTRKTSAQLTAHYVPEELVGRQVVAVINFPPKRIAGFKSEALVLGVPDGSGEVVLLSPDQEVPPGGRMF